MPSNLHYRAFLRLIVIEITMTCIAILIICVIYFMIHFYCKNSFQPNVFVTYSISKTKKKLPNSFYFSMKIIPLLLSQVKGPTVIFSLLIFFFQKFAKINMRNVEIGKRRVIAQTNINIGWLKIANHLVINVLVSLKRK